MKKYALKNEYVQIPNATVKNVEGDKEETISLQALGLIVNLWSYNVDTWELHKTELYKRYGHNKKTSVSNAWDELVEHKYIIEFKYRKGRSFEYVYIYRIEPFSDEEIEDIMNECVDVYGVGSTSDFQLLKMNSPKSTVQNEQVSNTILKKDSIKEIKTKDINPNPNLEEEEKEKNIYDILWDLKIPKDLKIKIKTLIKNNEIEITEGQLQDIQDAYVYQVFNELIIPNADMDDPDYLNDYKFSQSVVKMLEQVKNIENMKGLIKSYCLNAFSFYRSRLLESDYSENKNPNLDFDWTSDD